MAAIFEFFAKIAKHKNAYISKTVRDRAILTKFLTHLVSLHCTHPNFPKKLQNKNAYISKTCEIYFDEILDPQGISAE